jgi:sucrose-6F-phosphate phosphohydrolase
MDCWNLVFDIDFTLTGDTDALLALGRHVATLQEADQARVLLCTGRSYGGVLHGLAEEHLPEPDVIIAQTGAEIYLPPFTVDSEPWPVWHQELANSGFDCEDVKARLEPLNEVMNLEPEHCQTPWKVAYALTDSMRPRYWIERMRELLTTPEQRYQVVASFGYYIDVLPGRANKGKALQFLLEHMGWQDDPTVVNGDSGNDQSMFDEGFRGTLVANGQADLKEYLRGFSPDQVFLAEKRFAAGVLEGLQRWGVPLP